jgi:hypothetical protein
VINMWQFFFSFSFSFSSFSSVIYWTNQSKADSVMLFCDWLTILRPAWRQLAPGSCTLQLDYTVHAVHNVLYNWTAGNQFGLSWRVYTEYTLYKLLETSSAIMCIHTVQLICSLTRENRSSFSSQAGPESRRTWERTVYRPSYNAVGEALKPSVQSIPLHRVSRP